LTRKHTEVRTALRDHTTQESEDFHVDSYIMHLVMRRPGQVSSLDGTGPNKGATWTALARTSRSYCQWYSFFL